MPPSIAADLHVDLHVDEAPQVHAHLTGRDSRLELRVDDPSVFAGRGDTAMIVALAQMLSRQDLVVTVVHDCEPLVSIGAVRAPWWQRRLTGSRWIRLASWRGAVTSLRARVRARGRKSVLPDISIASPTTPWSSTPASDTRHSRHRRPT